MEKAPKAKCDHCHKEFITEHSNHRFCSKECREAFQGKAVFWLYERDGFRCFYCGKASYEDGVRLVIDHLIPKESGGTTTAGNLVTSCHTCNATKGKKSVTLLERMQSVISKRNARRGMTNSTLLRIHKPKRYADEGM